MENEATNYGAEPIEQSDTGQSTSDSDAELLSAYLTQEEQGYQFDDEGSSDDGQEQEIQKPAKDIFTVKVDGVEKQVDRDELIANYQINKASTQRFEEAAAIRKEAESQKEAYLQQQQVLSNAVQHFQNVAQQWAQQSQPNWQDLLENNPHEYLRQKELFEAKQVEVNKANATQQYLMQQQQTQEREYLGQHLEQEGKRLLDIIPEWQDKAKRTNEEQELISYLTNQGYSKQDLLNLNESRAANIKLALNAMRYDKLVNQAKSSNKKVENLPPRIERSGNSNIQKSGLDEAKSKLAKSGSLNDAAAAFAVMFGN